MQTDEAPTKPGTPSAMAAARESQAAAEIQVGNFRASIPAALLIAVITALSTTAAVRVTSADDPAEPRLQRLEKSVADIAEGQRELASAQREMLKKMGDESTAAANARTIDELRRADLERRLAAAGIR